MKLKVLTNKSLSLTLALVFACGLSVGFSEEPALAQGASAPSGTEMGNAGSGGRSKGMHRRGRRGGGKGHEGGGKGRKGGGRAKMMQRFDTNHDGTLDEAEKANLKKFRAERKAQRRAMQNDGSRSGQ